MSDTKNEAAEKDEPDQPAAELDPKARFREALERKNANPGSHPGSQASDGNSVGGSRGGKTKRQFRRKSG